MRSSRSRSCSPVRYRTNDRPDHARNPSTRVVFPPGHDSSLTSPSAVFSIARWHVTCKSSSREDIGTIRAVGLSLPSWQPLPCREHASRSASSSARLALPGGHGSSFHALGNVKVSLPTRGLELRSPAWSMGIPRGSRHDKAHLVACRGPDRRLSATRVSRRPPSRGGES